MLPHLWLPSRPRDAARFSSELGVNTAESQVRGSHGSTVSFSQDNALGGGALTPLDANFTAHFLR